MRPQPLLALLLVSWVVGVPAAWGTSCPDLYRNALTRLTSAAQQKAEYKTDGVFIQATEDQYARLAAVYKKAGIMKTLDGRIQRVAKGDLAVDLNSMKARDLKKLAQEGRAGLSSFYYFTSGAGLWSRGGGQVKALIPFNLKSLLSEQDFATLVLSGEIANASKVSDVLKLANYELHGSESAAETAASIIADRRALLSQLIAKARTNPGSLTPVDMKLATVAIASRKAGTYIPFDIWTSEQTHGPIRDYLSRFETTFRAKQFHPDPKVDNEIKDALATYLKQSRERGETHLFGYQIGYHALDPSTGAPVRDTALIGEGAGMAREYLEESGRAEELRRMGKHTWVFENIEVLTDLPTGVGAHRRAGTPVSVILVPEKAGYKGGSPFLIEKNGRKNLELHEMSALPPEFANGNQYFNSNTIFQSLDLAPPKSIGFEEKNSGTGKIVRAKMNAGDITHESSTSGIGGRIGIEYENFKNYREFGENGERLIDVFRAFWARDLK